MARGGFRIDQVGTKRATFDTDGSLVFTRDEKYGTALRHAPIVFNGEMQVGLAGDQAIPHGSLERIEPDGAAVVNWTGAIPFANGNAAPLAAGATDFVSDGAGNLVAATVADSGSTRVVVSVIGDTAWVLFG